MGWGDGGRVAVAPTSQMRRWRALTGGGVLPGARGGPFTSRGSNPSDETLPGATPFAHMGTFTVAVSPSEVPP